MKQTKIAIVPGSFDPITYGHIDIVKRALCEYDKVFLAVMINASKEYMFSLEERSEIAKAALSEFPNVEVIASDGMLWQLAKDLDAVGIVKGYRNDRDLAYEEEMAIFNAQHYPQAKTRLLPASDVWSTVSSTVVRQRIRDGLPLEGFLPQSAISCLQKILQDRV